MLLAHLGPPATYRHLRRSARRLGYYAFYYQVDLGSYLRERRLLWDYSAARQDQFVPHWWWEIRSLRNAKSHPDGDWHHLRTQIRDQTNTRHKTLSDLPLRPPPRSSQKVLVQRPANSSLPNDIFRHPCSRACRDRAFAYHRPRFQRRLGRPPNRRTLPLLAAWHQA